MEPTGPPPGSAAICGPRLRTLASLRRAFQRCSREGREPGPELLEEARAAGLIYYQAELDFSVPWIEREMKKPPG